MEEEEEEAKEESTAVIKPNNPHLAGGEQKTLNTEQRTHNTEHITRHRPLRPRDWKVRNTFIFTETELESKDSSGGQRIYKLREQQPFSLQELPRTSSAPGLVSPDDESCEESGEDRPVRPLDAFSMTGYNASPCCNVLPTAGRAEQRQATLLSCLVQANWRQGAQFGDGHKTAPGHYDGK